MSAPVFGRDVECSRCGEIHPAADPCREVEVSDRVYLYRANTWRQQNIGAHGVTSEDMCTAIGRPYNPKLIGAIFAEWQKSGYIRAVTIQIAKSKKRHGGTLRAWEIL